MRKILLLLLAILTSCEGNIFERRGEVVDVTGEVPHDLIVLGDKLEDPYTVENMTNALLSLDPSKAGRAPLAPTDYYVRFLPEDESEYERLAGMGIVMVDHPVDYEIIRDGDYYHDPSLEDDHITWQYAVVGKDFEFPDWVEWEKLDDCYLAENDPSTKADGIDWEEVERRSFELTGNAGLLRAVSRGETSGKPSGRISIVDEDLDDEPSGVRGVSVFCHSFVRFSTCTTDDEGYYASRKKFSSEVRYRLLFKNEKGFAIGLNEILLPASSSALGKGDPSGMSVVVTRDSDKMLFCRCAVNNAAYDYWNECVSMTPPVKTPPANLRIWLFRSLGSSSAVMMQQGSMVDGTLIGDLLGGKSWIVKMFLPDVTIGILSNQDYASLYALTVHELSHASHFMQAGVDFWDSLSEDIIKSFVTSGLKVYGTGTEGDHGYVEVSEMWAYYVETVLFKKRYPSSDLVFGTNYWFFPQIFLYLDERGLTMNRIFPALTPDVIDRAKLRARLLSLYPEYKSMINQAFERYV